MTPNRFTHAWMPYLEKYFVNLRTSNISDFMLVFVGVLNYIRRTGNTVLKAEINEFMCEGIMKARQQ